MSGDFQNQCSHSSTLEYECNLYSIVLFMCEYLYFMYIVCHASADKGSYSMYMYCIHLARIKWKQSFYSKHRQAFFPDYVFQSPYNCPRSAPSLNTLICRRSHVQYILYNVQMVAVEKKGQSIFRFSFLEFIDKPAEELCTITDNYFPKMWDTFFWYSLFACCPHCCDVRFMGCKTKMLRTIALIRLLSKDVLTHFSYRLWVLCICTGSGSTVTTTCKHTPVPKLTSSFSVSFSLSVLPYRSSPFLPALAWHL